MNAVRVSVDKTSPGLKLLEGVARIGYATRGLIYLFLGLLAIAAAVSEAKPPSLGGALSIIKQLPGGWIVLLGIAGGLCAYAAWRLIQAFRDVKQFGWSGKGLVRRAGMLMESTIYAGLGLLVAIMALAQNAGMRREMQDEVPFVAALTARALDWPLGHWLVAGVGVGAIVIGVGQLVRSRRLAFEDIRASERAMTVTRVVGRIGLAAKGAIFGAVGVLFLIAAWRANASGTGGIRAAPTFIANVPLGNWVVAAVSGGLVLYGVFCLTKAWLHKAVRAKDSKHAQREVT